MKRQITILDMHFIAHPNSHDQAQYVMNLILDYNFIELIDQVTYEYPCMLTNNRSICYQCTDRMFGEVIIVYKCLDVLLPNQHAVHH